MSESGGLSVSKKVKWWRVMHSKLQHQEDLVAKAKRAEERENDGKKRKVKKVLPES